MHRLFPMQSKKWVSWLVIPALAAIIAGVVLMLVRLGIDGVVAGGLLFAAGVDVFFISASRPPRLRHA